MIHSPHWITMTLLYIITPDQVLGLIFKFTWKFCPFTFWMIIDMWGHIAAILTFAFYLLYVAIASFSCVCACHYSLMIFCEDFLTFLFFHFLPLLQFWVLWLLWNLCKVLKYNIVLFLVIEYFLHLSIQVLPFSSFSFMYCLKLPLFTSYICSKLK